MQILLMQNYKVIMQMQLSSSLLTNIQSSSQRTGFSLSLVLSLSLSLQLYTFFQGTENV